MITEAPTPMPTVATLGNTNAPTVSSRRIPGDGPTAKQMVLEAVLELHNQSLPITRESLSRVCGFRVDDAIKALKEQGLIWAPERGVYRPIDAHPPARPISKTILPTGVVKIEIGDDMITLTPEENRRLAELQAGAAAQVAALEGANAVLEMANMVQAMFRSNDYKQRQGLKSSEGER